MSLSASSLPAKATHCQQHPNQKGAAEKVFARGLETILTIFGRTKTIDPGAGTEEADVAEVVVAEAVVVEAEGLVEGSRP